MTSPDLPGAWEPNDWIPAANGGGGLSDYSQWDQPRIDAMIQDRALAMIDSAIGDFTDAGLPLAGISSLLHALVSFMQGDRASLEDLLGDDPLTGLFIDFVEAIQGIYRGSDGGLQAVQAILAPLRAIFSLLTGGGNPADWTSDPKLDQLQDDLPGLVIRLPLQALADAIGNSVPIVGDQIAQGVGSWLLNMEQGVGSAGSMIEQLNGNSAWIGLDMAGDASTTYHNINSDLEVSANKAQWCFIRSQRASKKKALTYLAKKSGTVTTLNFDVYRLDANPLSPTYGQVTRLFSSDNQQGYVDGAYGWGQIDLPGELVVWFGDWLAVQARMTGAGTVWVAGTSTVGAFNSPIRPYHFGGFRNASASPAPDTLNQAAVDAIYASHIPFFQIGSGAGIDYNAKRTISDNFANLSKWLLKTTAGSNNMTVEGGYTKFNGNTDGTQGGIYQMALNSDDFNVYITAQAPTNYTQGLVMASDNTMSNYVYLGLVNTQAALMTVQGGDVSTAGTQQANKYELFGITAGTWMVTFRIATRTWKVFRNTTDDTGTPYMTWTDSGNVMTHGPGHRYFGVRMQRASFNNSAGWAAFSAADIALE